MSLPRRKQTRLTGMMQLNGITPEIFCKVLDINRVRYSNLKQGNTYPSPRELDLIERMFNGMPAEVYFDVEMLSFRENWPPPRGFASSEVVKRANARRWSKSGDSDA